MSIETDQNRVRAAAAPTVGTFGGAAATVAPGPHYGSGNAWGANPPVSAQPSAFQKSRANAIVGVCLALAVGLFAAHGAHVWPFAKKQPVQSQGQPSGGQGQPSGAQGQPSGGQGQSTGQGSNNGSLPLPSDINKSSCGDGSSDAASTGLGSGLVQALECPEPSLANGTFGIFAYGNSSDLNQALGVFNGNVGFDPSSASNSCPPSGGSSVGIVSSGPLNVECGQSATGNVLVIEDTNANVLMVVSTTSDWPTIQQWLSNLQLS